MKKVGVIVGLLLAFVAGCATSIQEEVNTTETNQINEKKEENQVGVFNFNTHKVLLNSGYEMPIMGLGTYSLDHDTCVNSVKELLKNGGRLIDTAYMYHNEEAVGEGVRAAMEEYGIPREEIFVITKIYPSQFNNPQEAIELALEKLDIGYIDMMLLHHPGTNDVEAYLEMVVQCWYPLGGRGFTSELLNDETIVNIAENHDVSSAQVILRWDLQRQIVVIPGSSNPDHIKENLDLFGFELSEEEMEQINALNRNEKHDWY